jgi:hypothetical protein
MSVFRVVLGSSFLISYLYFLIWPSLDSINNKEYELLGLIATAGCSYVVFSLLSDVYFIQRDLTEIQFDLKYGDEARNQKLDEINKNLKDINDNLSSIERKSR